MQQQILLSNLLFFFFSLWVLEGLIWVWMLGFTQRWGWPGGGSESIKYFILQPSDLGGKPKGWTLAVLTQHLALDGVGLVEKKRFFLSKGVFFKREKPLSKWISKYLLKNSASLWLVMIFGVKAMKPRAEECLCNTATLAGIQCRIYWDPVLSFAGKICNFQFYNEQQQSVVSFKKGVSILESWRFC